MVAVGTTIADRPPHGAVRAALPHTIGDLMDWKGRYLTGSRGVNCGRVKVGNDATSATQCALRADADGQPFRVAYEIQGYDAIVAGGIVRRPDGQVFALNYIVVQAAAVTICLNNPPKSRHAPDRTTSM
jgi:hypothetical protein